MGESQDPWEWQKSSHISLEANGFRESTATKAIPPNGCQVFPLFGGESGRHCPQQKELEVC